MIADETDFEVMIATALHNAHTPWEKRFIDDVHGRYVKYGARIFANKNQMNKLQELQTSYEDEK